MTALPLPLALGSLAAVAATVVLGPAPGVEGRHHRPLPDRSRRPGRSTGAPILGLAPADVAVAAAVALVLGLVLPPLALAGPAVPVLRRHRARRRARLAHERAVASGLPDAVDLLLLCAGAGLSLPLAHPLVAVRIAGPVGAALQEACVATDAGEVRADALRRALVPLGDRAAALGHVLVDHLRYGVPLAPALERLGLELKLDRRRRAEEDARRVPLRLLAPLLCCVLPAFGLLTVVPLLVATLQSLPR